MILSLTYFKNLTSPQGQRVSTTWEKLVERLRAPRVAAVKRDVPGLSLSTYVGDYRRGERVELSPRLSFDGCNSAYPKALMISVYSSGMSGFDVWRWK